MSGHAIKSIKLINLLQLHSTPVMYSAHRCSLIYSLQAVTMFMKIDTNCEGYVDWVCTLMCEHCICELQLSRTSSVLTCCWPTKKET